MSYSIYLTIRFPKISLILLIAQLLIVIANADENEDKLTEVINSMYRTEILNKEFSSIDEYVKEWGKFQNKFIEETDSYKKYEVWCKFSQEKIQDG